MNFSLNIIVILQKYMLSSGDIKFFSSNWVIYLFNILYFWLNVIEFEFNQLSTNSFILWKYSLWKTSLNVWWGRMCGNWLWPFLGVFSLNKNRFRLVEIIVFIFRLKYAYNGSYYQNNNMSYVSSPYKCWFKWTSYNINLFGYNLG